MEKMTHLNRTVGAGAVKTPAADQQQPERTPPRSGLKVRYWVAAAALLVLAAACGKKETKPTPKPVTGEVVATPADWEAAVTKANASGQPANFAVNGNLTLPAGALFPTVALTLNGSGTVTLTPAIPATTANTSSTATINTVLDPTQYNAFAVIPDNLTVACKLAVNNGIIRATDLTLADGGSLAGPGRLALSGALNVASGAKVSIAESMVVSCSTLNNGGTITNSGALYYNTGTPATVNTNAAVLTTGISAEGPQVPNMGFEDWMEDKTTGLFGGDIWYISADKNDVYWDSGNPGTGLNFGGGTSLTLEETVLKVEGAKAAKLYSTKLGTIIADMFGAGNMFVGKFGSVDAIKGGVEFTSGRPYKERPLALSGQYNYMPGDIDYENGAPVTPASPRKDACDMYIALSTKAYSVNTTELKSYPDLINDPEIVAYGRISTDQNTNGYKPFRIFLKYKDYAVKYADSKPLYLLITMASSKDGDKFTGSTHSVLYLDAFKLEF